MNKPREKEEIELLSSIGSTEASTFAEFLRELPDAPERGDRDGWRELFGRIEWAEHMDWVGVERNSGRIEQLQLTEAGAARLKELKTHRCSRLESK